MLLAACKDSGRANLVTREMVKLKRRGLAESDLTPVLQSLLASQVCCRFDVGCVSVVVVMTALVVASEIS